MGEDVACKQMQAYSEEIDVDWEVYGWLCFSHRSVVLRALTEPMQPAKIKRKIRSRHPNARISANNVRDVIRLFLAKGIVRQVFTKKQSLPRYELTELGCVYQRLLNQADRFV